MSFAFGFAGDDIDDDDHDMLDAEPSGEGVAKTAPSLLLPKMHALSDLVSHHAASSAWSVETCSVGERSPHRRTSLLIDPAFGFSFTAILQYPSSYAHIEPRPSISLRHSPTAHG